MHAATPDRHLDPRAITLWRLLRVLRLFTFGFPLSAAVGWGVVQVTDLVPLGVTIGGALALWYCVMAVVWPVLAWRHYKYAVREHDLLVQSGVLFRRWSAIPLGRIQHVDTRQGPIERALGLSRLLVYTAAGMSADGSIPGLADEDVQRLRDELARRGGDDGV
jgi:membrane protein YdbS with pleckstrin-like domain